MLAPAPTTTARSHALAVQLLDRHGVLTREALRAESVAGGFGAVYPVLKALEEAGQVRRGYVVAGLGAAQFAAVGAIDRLRGYRDADEHAPEVVLLAATDPAQPYGAALPWPDSAGRPARAAGAFVVLVDGRPAVFVERGARSLITFEHPCAPERWLAALHTLIRSGRLRKLEIVRVDSLAVHDTPWAGRLVAVGFTPGYRGLTLRG